MSLKIAIIGAGPAGCMLARLLQQSSEQISVTIFESEGSINFRSQGGTLDLHEKTGLAAMKAANLFEEFQKHARYDGEAMAIADKDLLCYVKENAKDKSAISGRPEIDRPRLREILYNSLKENTVVWNYKLQSVDSDLTLHFANGKVEKDFDLLVGADGAWSHVRPRLTNDRPSFTGIAGHALSIPNAEETQPELHKLVNRGSLFAWSDGKSIMAQQMGDGSLSVGSWAIRSDNWEEEAGYDVHDAKAVKEAVRREFDGWDERLVRFTQVAEDHVVPRGLYMLPIGNRWEHVKGVTLVGDAAHLMSPFAGEGVNLAFSDSLALAQSILSAASKVPEEQHAALDENVASFEQDMFARAKVVQQTSFDMMNLKFFYPGSPRTAIEKYILRAIEGEIGKWTLLAKPLVYAYFGLFKMFH